MKILVIGAGAVGGYFGGRLARSRTCDVTFAARGETLSVLTDRGLTVHSVDGDFAVHPIAAARLDAIEDTFDLVLVCVKSFHLPEILPFLQSVRKPDTPVISLLNGLGSEEAIAKAVGPQHALGGVAYVGALVERPGVVVHSSLGFLKVGRLDGQADPRLGRFEEVCRQAGIRCDISADIVRDIWKKLLWNASFNPVTALGRSDSAEVLATPDAESIVTAAMMEIARVARAHGIALEDDLVRTMVEDTRGRAPIRTSMQDDAQSGKRIEADALCGAVVALARKKGIDVPVNRTLYGLLQLLDERARRASRPDAR